jgi:Dihydrofolate reductase
MISIIVAIANDNAIGANNNLLWHISEDLRYFKRVTAGHTVVMGRNTWSSIGRPLPGRRNIVVSKSVSHIEGAEVYPTLEEALNAANAHSPEEEVFIIGGGQIYEQCLPIADKLYLTVVYAQYPQATIFFPEIDYTQWREISREYHPHGEKFEYPFEFLLFER